MILVDPDPRECRRLRELNDRLPLVIEDVRLGHSDGVVPIVLIDHVVELLIAESELGLDDRAKLLHELHKHGLLFFQNEKYRVGFQA